MMLNKLLDDDVVQEFSIKNKNKKIFLFFFQKNNILIDFVVVVDIYLIFVVDFLQLIYDDVDFVLLFVYVL